MAVQVLVAGQPPCTLHRTLSACLRLAGAPSVDCTALGRMESLWVQLCSSTTCTPAPHLHCLHVVAPAQCTARPGGVAAGACVRVGEGRLSDGCGLLGGVMHAHTWPCRTISWERDIPATPQRKLAIPASSSSINSCHHLQPLARRLACCLHHAFGDAGCASTCGVPMSTCRLVHVVRARLPRALCLCFTSRTAACAAPGCHDTQ